MSDKTCETLWMESFGFFWVWVSVLFLSSCLVLRANTKITHKSGRTLWIMCTQTQTHCCLQGQLCGLCLWFWPKRKMRMILRIKITLQNDAAKMTLQKWCKCHHDVADSVVLCNFSCCCKIFIIKLIASGAISMPCSWSGWYVDASGAISMPFSWSGWYIDSPSHL